MPSKYKRKTTRATSYSKDDLEIAIRRVRNRELTNYAASQMYGIPTSTLNDRVRERTGILSQSLGRPTVIPTNMEAELANSLRTLEKWGWGLSKEEVLDLVAAFIKTNGIKTPFQDDRPGDAWFVAFRKRHNLSVKKPQTVEYLRKRMTDPFVVDEYFTILEEELSKLKLHDEPHKIWNLDETSVSLDPTKTKVVGGVGLPCTRTTAGTGKENVTVLTTVNAAGKKLDPLIVFKGKNVYEQWMAEKTNYDFELAYAASKRGWMESDIFHNYMEKIFIPNLGDERPVLMIYDGHVTHVDNRVVSLAVENGITILKLPAHTSHLLQPLDLAVFKSFKSIWDKQLVRWQRENIGSKVRKQAFADMFAKAWNETKPEVIRNGFKKGGIYPLNPSVIPKDKFDPSAYKRWQLHISKKKMQQPKTLSQICTETINKQMFDNNYSTTQLQTDHSTECSKEPNAINKTFEDLLLESIRQSNNNNNKTATKLKKVASGADVITRTFLDKKKEMELQMTQEVLHQNCQIPGPSGMRRNQHTRRNILEDKTNAVVHSKEKQGDKKGQGHGKGIVQGKGKGKSKGLDNKHKKEKAEEQKNKTVTKKKQEKKHGKEKAPNSCLEPDKKPKARRGRRSSSLDTSSDSIEISVHDDSDIQDCISDILNDSDTAEFDVYLNINNKEMFEQKELSREEEIEKIVKEIQEFDEKSINREASMGQEEMPIKKIKRENKNTEEIPVKKQKIEQLQNSYPLIEIPGSSKQVENTEKKKVTILESIPINCNTKKNMKKIKIQKTGLKVIDKYFDISATQKHRSSQNHVKDLIQNTYNIGDTILTRYFNKKKWKYFVGVLDSKNEGLYTISYYRAVRKQGQTLTFVKPKRKDVDDVPADNIVKAIELRQLVENPPQYVLMNEEDGIYF